MGMLCLKHQANLPGMAPQHASQLLSSSITCTCAVQPSYKSLCICIALYDLGAEAAASCQAREVASRAKPNSCDLSCLKDVQADSPCPILHVWVPAQGLKLHSGRLEGVVMGEFKAELVGVPLVRCTGRTLQAMTQSLNVQQAPCLAVYGIGSTTHWVKRPICSKD